MMTTPPRSRLIVCLAATLAACTATPSAHARNLEPIAPAAEQAPSQTSSTELEEMLFVQAPENGIPKDGIHLIWLPEPLQKLCLGKTASRCATIDYCIRTTNSDDSRCRNLGVNLARIPNYPPGTRPARMISLTLFKIREYNGNGYGKLQEFYKSLPPASLNRLSLNARVKARIQFTRKPDDDDFNLLQILAVGDTH
ncbi:hypothetical protein [Occallatibacter savannae]|uniref:hypothetical protein n=1 Tax=Occallatibacter savannae TaxID=1002691 RepID=UPI000D68EA45|nr:hypothetical protein [Occallatibacter savannae]